MVSQTERADPWSMWSWLAAAHSRRGRRDGGVSDQNATLYHITSQVNTPAGPSFVRSFIHSFTQATQAP